MSTLQPEAAAGPMAPPAGPCIVAIFGASGDLTQRKLIPALYNLMSHNLLPEAFAVVGVDRADETRETLRGRLTQAVRGQYGAGVLASGEPLPAYRSEPGVAPESRTETYVALKLVIDNWRWAGVPFYLRTGKRLPIAYTEIAIQFKRAPFVLFRDTPVHHLSPNVLVLRIQPAEGIEMTFGAKVPGPAMRLGNVHMDFCYSDYFGGAPGTGYESLIYDCMNGDATLFKRADNVEAGWALVEPILDVWSALPSRSFPNYPAGSWGPPEADTLLRKDGRQWRPIESIGARRRDH